MDAGSAAGATLASLATRLPFPARYAQAPVRLPGGNRRCNRRGSNAARVAYRRGWVLVPGRPTGQSGLGAGSAPTRILPRIGLFVKGLSFGPSTSRPTLRAPRGPGPTMDRGCLAFVVLASQVRRTRPAPGPVRRTWAITAAQRERRYSPCQSPSTKTRARGRLRRRHRPGKRRRFCRLRPPRSRPSTPRHPSWS